MDQQTEKFHIVRQLVKKDFDYEIIVENSWDEMKKDLAAFINVLLNKDFERLLQGLYRIDVDEEKVKEILNVRSPEFIADDLAQLILERQQQKAITRMQYR